MVQVVRGGIVEISIKEIVVGDILQFGIGDIFPVDGTWYYFNLGLMI